MRDFLFLFRREVLYFDFFFCFSVEEKEPRVAVLEKILERAKILLSVGRSDTMIAERLAAWDEICVFAHQFGVTDGLKTRDDFRNGIYKGWKKNFRVCVFNFIHLVCCRLNICSFDFLFCFS